MNQLHTSHPRHSFGSNIANEMIGVSKIKLRRPNAQSMAVLCSFISADKLLRDWAAGTPGRFQCEFEIHYLDGSELCGSIARRYRNRGCLSLGGYVRQTIMETEATAPDALPVLRFARRLGRQGLRSEAVDAAFLCTYETEDFGGVDRADD